MQLRNPLRILACLALLLAVTGTRVAVAGEPLQVYTVNYPLAYFAERIAGDLAEVHFPAPADQDPAFWMPDDDTIAAYQSADLILLNGAAYAKWVEKVSLPRSRVVDTSRALRDAYIRDMERTHHSHGPAGDHSHGGVAFTTWLDMDQAAAQADAVARALIRRLPDQEPRLAAGLASLRDDLMGLDARFAALAERVSGRPLLASHQVYQYLARGYGFNIQSVMWEPEEDPGEAEWRALETRLAGFPAEWMIWEGEPAPAGVERLGALGVQSTVLAPGGNRPPAGNFLGVMEANLDRLERAWQ